MVSTASELQTSDIKVQAVRKVDVLWKHEKSKNKKRKRNTRDAGNGLPTSQPVYKHTLVTA